MTFLKQSERAKKVLRDLHNYYLAGTENYPMIVTGVYELLVNYKREKKLLLLIAKENKITFVQ